MSMRVVVPFEPSPIDVAFVAPISSKPASRVSSPLLIATLMSPAESTVKFVKVIVPVVPSISFAPIFIAFTISESDTSIASVIPPASEFMKIPFATTSSESELSIYRTASNPCVDATLSK